MFAAEVEGRSGISAAVARLVTLWALLGGALLLVIVLINIASVVGAVVAKPFPGDFELTEMGVAVAVFAFLPYCQLTDANVTADIFTANAPGPVLAVLRALASLIAFGFACILVWRMYLGMLDQKAYNYTTTILQLPIWWAFVPILVSLVLLIAAAALTFKESLSEVRP
ncbi:C4-dicarboxylate ABC transporter [Salipiger sp. CCB-MM3]|uniref:TRAP transporter small permease n=1 Tax=Roseobacteraceae TaxID=2854170 RepID=UPI00080A989B|nr:MULTISPECIES: TRAP transporter small permease [Roseobacteraceae]ANT61261.1 C4-dicarboxylate ABC transporter [Salipiger sp. CCB-MM3]MCA0994474.1 TRAP transporter small permease [Alloyangia pacifica]